MFNSQYYTCEQIDERLLQGYVDDFNEVNSTNYSKDELLLKLFQAINWDQVFGKYQENSEFVRVYLDATNKVLWGIRTNGDIYYGADVPSQIKNYIDSKIRESPFNRVEDILIFLDDLIDSDKTLKELLSELYEDLDIKKVDKEEGKSLIDAKYASTKSSIENPEFIEAIKDSEDKVVEGIRTNGRKYLPSGIDFNIVEMYEEDNPEWAQVVVDSHKRIIEGIKKNGEKYFAYPFIDKDRMNLETVSIIDTIINSEKICDNKDSITSESKDIALLDSVKRGNTQDIITLNLPTGTRRKFILNLHKSNGENQKSYNNVYLPNAADDFSDVKVKDDNGNILPYSVISKTDIDFIQPSAWPNNSVRINSRGELIGGSGSTLIHSLDGGITWSQMTQFAQYSVGSMYVLYVADDDTLFFSSGGYLYKSSYPYESATSVLDITDPTVYNQITGEHLSSMTGCYILPQGFVKFGGSLYCHGYQAEDWIRVYKSDDEGNTWSLTLNVIQDGVYRTDEYQHVHNLYVDIVNNPNALYAGCDPMGHTYKTTDGTNWIDIWSYDKWKRSTDYGVIYAGNGFRLLGGETSWKGGVTIQKTTDDIHARTVLATGHGCYKVVKYGKYLIAGIIATQQWRSSGLLISEDDGETWKTAYYIPKVGTNGASDGTRYIDSISINNEDIVFVQCQNYDNTLLIKEGRFSQIIVDVPDECTSLTVESGYLKGNIAGIFNDEKENGLLLDMPFNENGNNLLERTKSILFSGNYSWENIGRSIGDILPKITKNSDMFSFCIDGDSDGFNVGNINLSHGFHIGFWSRLSTNNVWILLSIGGQTLSIVSHMLQINNVKSIGLVHQIVEGTFDRFDINVDSEGNITIYTNGEELPNPQNYKVPELLVAGEAKICKAQMIKFPAPIQHLTISSNQITQDDALRFYNSGLNDCH